MTDAISSKSSPWSARTSSGSRRSPTVVKPARSAKSTVTGRRSLPISPGARAGGADGCAASPRGGAVAAGRSAAPHFGQKANSAGQAKPHPGHALSSARPHRGQNAKSAAASPPQPGHFMVGSACRRSTARRTGPSTWSRARSAAWDRVAWCALPLPASLLQGGRVARMSADPTAGPHGGCAGATNGDGGPLTLTPFGPRLMRSGQRLAPT
jgi:hypothetical protein